jgi:hypothetical protein
MLHRRSPAEFNRLFMGDPGAYQEFWEHEFGQGWTRANEALNRFDTWESVKAIPLGLHGDDAQYVKHGS